MERDDDVVVASGNMPIPLHLLGWKSFQDLAIAVAEECLRRPVQNFLPTNDAGRDGAFVGRWDGDSPEAGESTIQCKFTSKPNRNLVLSLLTDELEKAKILAARGLAKDYIILTNHSVSGQSELAIKSAFEAAGVGRCRVFAFDFLERQIHKSPRLRMLAPRVYGLADLSQLLDQRSYRQAKLILESLGDDLKKLVVTEAHRRAVRAISQHNIVLLLGGPAAGKSTIGASIAVGAADIWQSKTIRVTSPQMLEKKLEPKTNQFFWIDDAWGNTQYHRQNTEAWNQLLPLIQGAMHKGARFLITSRDYVWKQARQDLKLHALPALTRSQVVIDVQAFATQEKAQILYNHLKLGDQPIDFLKSCKEYLPELAENKNFLPEVARRFALTFFTGKISPTKSWAQLFFDNPQGFLRDTISGLSPECKAAVSLVFQNSAIVRSPVSEQKLNSAAAHFGVQAGAVRAELENLNGSLLLLMSDEEGPFWTYKHPTVGDAFAKFVSESPELIEVYLLGASPGAISREVVCAGIELYGAPVVVPNSLHGLLLAKVLRLQEHEIVSFLSYRSNKVFAARIIESKPEILLRLRNFYVPLKEDVDASCAAKLFEFGLLPEEYRVLLVKQLKEAAAEHADDSAIADEALAAVLTTDERQDLLNEVKAEVLDRIQYHVDRTRSEWSNEYDPDDHFTSLTESIEAFATAIGNSEYAKHAVGELSAHITAAVDSMNEEYEPPATVSAPTASSSRSAVLSNLFRDIDE